MTQEIKPIAAIHDDSRVLNTCIQIWRTDTKIRRMQVDLPEFLVGSNRVRLTGLGLPGKNVRGWDDGEKPI